MFGVDVTQFIVISILIGTVVILLIREIVTWYWKINAILYEQKQTNQMLEHICKKLDDFLKK